MKPPAAPVAVAALLSSVVAGYCLLPPGAPREVGYPAVGLLCLVVAFSGPVRSASHCPTGWLLVLAGYAGWVSGDIMYLIEKEVLGLTAYPAASDALYVSSYVLIAAGLAVMVRRRGNQGDIPAVLDASILATGTAVVAGVFVIAPIAHDSTLALFAKLISSFYPLADVLLLAILVRLWTTVGAGTAAYRLLSASLAMTLLADAMYDASVLIGDDIGSLLLNDVVWLLGYVLIAAAAWAPVRDEFAGALPGREEFADPTRRLIALTGGLVLPALALVVDGLDGGGVSWAIIASGSVALSVMVLSRMAGLLAVVRAQAVQLAALARLDPLTGVSNRRSLDHELSRACRAAREQQSMLSVALVDLDHFKIYNDTFGHPAGDRLLCEATTAWMDVLSPEQMLARYGGEEFVVLFPGLTAARARERVLDLLRVMPAGQTFSAGIATWDPRTEPSAALAAADVALYHAKRGGRRRICLAADEEIGRDAGVRGTADDRVRRA